jgi:hypothetical protein
LRLTWHPVWTNLDADQQGRKRGNEFMQPRAITEKIIAAHALEGPVGPGRIATLTPDVLLLNDVSGPLALYQFAAIFFRNVINLGLPVLICAEAAGGIEAGKVATVVVSIGEIRQSGRTWKAQPLAGEVAAILACGGLMERTRAVLSARAAGNAVEPDVRRPDQGSLGTHIPASSCEESR